MVINWVFKNFFYMERCNFKMVLVFERFINGKLLEIERVKVYVNFSVICVIL